MDEEKLKKFVKLIASVDFKSFVTKKDMDAFAKELVCSIRNLQDVNLNTKEELHSQYGSFIDIIDNKIISLEESTSSSNKSESQALLVLLNDTKVLASKLLSTKVLNGVDGKDGKDGNDGKDGEKGLSGENGKDGNDLTAEDIVSKLNQKEGLLLATTIKGLPEFVNHVAKETINKKGDNYVPISLSQSGTLITSQASKINFTGATLSQNGDTTTVAITGGGGSGTVTSVSVTPANGVSGTVATATTTPAITLALGDITPTSVTTPSIIGGTAVGSGITYKSTTGAGTPTTIAHQFTGGTNGATVAATILNNGYVGVGTVAPKTILSVVESTINSLVMTLGTASGIFSIQALGNIYGLFAGVKYDTGDAWVQVGRSDGVATAYNLLLQPCGGNIVLPGTGIWNSSGKVGIGIVSPASPLHVKGIVSIENASITDTATLSLTNPYYGRLNFSVPPINGKSEVRYVSKGAVSGTGQTYFVIASSENSDTGNNLLMGVAAGRTFITNALNYSTAGITHLGGQGWNTDGVIQISGDSPTGQMTVMGKIGIGNTAPGAMLDLGLAGATLGVIRLAGSTSGNVTIQPNAVAGTGIVLTLPATTGTLVTGGGTASGTNTGDQIPGITRTVANISTSITAGAAALTDYDYYVTATATLTLPTAVGNTNHYSVKAVTGTTTVATTSAQTINGSTTATVLAGSVITLGSDNSNWHII